VTNPSFPGSCATSSSPGARAGGETYEIEYFNLEAILSVGYRVNSMRGTQFLEDERPGPPLSRGDAD